MIQMDCPVCGSTGPADKEEQCRRCVAERRTKPLIQIGNVVFLLGAVLPVMLGVLAVGVLILVLARFINVMLRAL